MTEPIKLPQCLVMKYRIQEELLDRYAGLSNEERQKRELEDINADPILGPMFRRLQDKGNVISPTHHLAAEERANYL